MTVPQAAVTVTVPDEWDLRAELGPIGAAEFFWERLADTLSTTGLTVNERAGEVVGCSWQGPAADSYMLHALRLWPDTIEAGESARRVSECLRDAAMVLRRAQEQLDNGWLRLRRRVDVAQIGENTVQAVLRNAADQAALTRAVHAAREIRAHANDGLAGIAQRVDEAVNRVYQLIDAWTELTDPGTTEWGLPPGADATTLVRVGDRVFVTRGVSTPGDPYNVIPDTVTVTVDPNTGEQIVTVNGVEHRFGRGVNVIVRDGFGAGALPVGSYSPSPGIHVDRTGDSVRVTARLELYGEGATPERAREIEEGIRAAWNRRFGDGTSIATDVRVTYRPPGAPAAADATQIEMAPTLGPSHVNTVTGEMTLNTNEPNVTGVAPHEFGHQIGLRDRYQESILSSVGGMVGLERTSHPEPGYQGNIMSDLGPVQGKNVRDLASENIPTVFSSDDQVRDWVSRSSPAEAAAVATTTKVRMVDSLMDGWISDADVTAIESICRTARPGDQAEAVRAAVSARLDEMWGSEQRARLQAAINGMR